MFTRGQTQVLSVTTSVLRRRSDYRRNWRGGRRKVHYTTITSQCKRNKPLRSPTQARIGHGALAERALIPVLPDVDDFYAIRVVLSSLLNGSSSMASCGNTHPYDAGVPIKAPVAGIAMGLIEKDGKVAILSDIQGMEDFLGDMDFKVAGTAKGVTTIQMDIKVHGLSRQILQGALKQAKRGKNVHHE